MSRGSNSVRISVDMASVNAMLDSLGSSVEQAVRPAAQAAAQVFYDDVRANVAAIGRKTGNLQRSIYQAFSPENSGATRAEYHVSWNAKIAPHAGLIEGGHLQRYRYYKRADGQIRPMVRPGMENSKKPGRHASQSAKDAYYVTLPVPLQVAARPFIRPALKKMEAAIKAASDELFNRIDGAL